VVGESGVAHNVFVAYAFHNQALAETVRDACVEAGLGTWLASDERMGANPLTDDVKEAIESSACVLVVLTDQANRSRWVAREVDHALGRSKRVVFVAFGGAKPGSHFSAQARVLARIETGSALTPKARAQLLRDVKSIVDQTCPIVTMLNLKGGVGKTTLAANLFGCLHEGQDKSVLLIDFDPQHNLTQLILPAQKIDLCWNADQDVLSIFEPSKLSARATPSSSLFDISTEGERAGLSAIVLPLKPAPAGAPRFDIVPGHFAAIKYALPAAHAKRPALDASLAAFLAEAQRAYDLIVFDVNPGASALTEMSIQHSTHVLAPVRPDRFSNHGIDLLSQLLAEVYKPTKPLKKLAIVNGARRGSNWWPSMASAQFKVLKSRISYSTLLRPLEPASAFGADYTRELAYKSNAGNARQVRQELAAAAAELADELLGPV
jgi:chromosome partitioning protein